MGRASFSALSAVSINPMFDLTHEKTRARLQAKQRRATVADRGAASIELIRHFPASIFQGQVIGGIWPLPAEVDTRPLLQALSEAGFTLALPRTPRKGKPLSFYHWAWEEPLRAGPYGTRQPAADAALLTPDIILVPLLAFTRGGARLGYGGGYYDRTLSALRLANPSVFACGVGFAAQEASDLPTDSYDQMLDAVLTEREFLRVQQKD